MKKYSVLLPILVLAIGLLSFVKPSGLKVGDKAVAFSLKNVDGNLVSLSKNAGAKGAIVVFTCNHCPFSQMYEGRIIALHNKFSGKGYPVIAINPNDPNIQPDDSFEKMQTLAKSKGYTFPYLVDETQETAKAYGAEKTPHVFLLSRSGEDFKVEYIGAIDNNANDANKASEKYVEAALEELLAGKKVSNSSRKAIGCGIKWKS